MSYSEKRLQQIVGITDASIFFLALVGMVGGVLHANLGWAMLWSLLCASAFVGWRGAVSVRNILSGKIGLKRFALEGFLSVFGIMLAFFTFGPPLQWQSYVMAILPLSLVMGVAGAFAYFVLYFVNSAIIRANSSPKPDARTDSMETTSGFHAIGKLPGRAIITALLVIVVFAVAVMKYSGRSSNDALNVAPGEQATSDAKPTYQDLIDKVLPGYTIFRNEDFLQDEKQLQNFLSSYEIARRSGRSLGVIEGRFNEDAFRDFAALVINRSVTQTVPAQEVKAGKTDKEFSVRLVICLGTKQLSEYQCDILSTLDGDFISLPYWAEFVVFEAPGELSCGDTESGVAAEDDTSVQVFYPEKQSDKMEAIQLGVAARRLDLNYDGIGIYAIGRNYGWTLIRQADGSYLNCATPD